LLRISGNNNLHAAPGGVVAVCCRIPSIIMQDYFGSGLAGMGSPVFCRSIVSGIRQWTTGDKLF